MRKPKVGETWLHLGYSERPVLEISILSAAGDRTGVIVKTRVSGSEYWLTLDYWLANYTPPKPPSPITEDVVLRWFGSRGHGSWLTANPLHHTEPAVVLHPDGTWSAA